jgi:hypothetical protein
MDADSDRQDQNALQIFRTVTIPGSVTQNDLHRKCELFTKLKYENVIKLKNNPDPALRTSYLSNEIKKDTKISRDYPSKSA